MKYCILRDKYIDTEYGRLYRIQALIDFGDVKKGEVGGYIQHSKNLAQCGNCWVHNNAQVYDEAVVYGDAQVYGNAKVYDEASIINNAQVYGDAKVYGCVYIRGNAQKYDDAKMYGCAYEGSDTQAPKHTRTLKYKTT